MIKPESLWGLFKSCDDSKWLGDICRALGRQDVELDFGQKQMLKTIEQDSGWMDERIEDRRERDRLRKQKSRASQVVTRNPCDTVESANSLPSIHPSIQPSMSNTTAQAPRGVPMEDLLVHCHNQGIPKEFAKTFHEEMVALGWQVKTTTKQGVIVPSKVNRANAGLIMGTWWNQRKKNNQKSSVPEGMIYKQEGYDASKLGI